MKDLCGVCKKAIKPEELLLQVHTVVENERRGNYVWATFLYVHLKCVQLDPRW